ncbi:MAG: radical SAM protein [Erysipelotrichaceae bacterium]|nr:radical SAM protein [Erysipelotrichaceae bacterium]
MKKLTEAKQSILNLIGQSLPNKETLMKRSKYVVPFDIDGRKLFYNTLTGECLIMEENDDLQETILYQPGMDISEELITHRFYVKNETDEFKSYCGLLSLLRVMQRSDDIYYFTILPTTHCNARCFYCFEKDFHGITMSDETIQKTVDLIERKHGNKRVWISWFGGEPLVGIQNIRKINSELNKRNIPYASSMISNGSLFNEEIINEAKNDWNLKMVQITLDGDREEYIRRKNYINSDHFVFDRVLNNIKMLQKAGITVMVRLNIDFDNYQSVLNLVEKMDRCFEEKDGITVSTSVLYQEQADQNSVELWKKALEMNSLFRKKGFKTVQKYDLKAARAYYCMADSPEAIVINADGTLFACEHCNEENRICHIEAFKEKDTKKTAVVSEIEEKCHDCPLLAICTDFNNCPNRLYDCRAIKTLLVEDMLRAMLEQKN